MPGINDPALVGNATAQKILHLLSPLRRSSSGAVLLRQIERMLGELTCDARDREKALAAVVGNLLESYARQLHSGSPLQMQVRLLQTRLTPPISPGDMTVLHDYADAYADQIERLAFFDAGVLEQTLEPLLRDMHLQTQSPPPESEPVTLGEAPGPETAYVPPPKTEPVSMGEAAGLETAYVPPSRSDAPVQEPMPLVANGHETAPAPAVRLPQAAPAPTAGEDYSPVAEQRVDSVYRSHLDAKSRDIQQLQQGLAQRVLETISKNQEFGVLLDLVLGEVRDADDIHELENLRWTLIRELEKLTSGHRDLADKLDNAHQFLQAVESDSRQLSDELTRVRLLSLTDELTGLPNRRAFLRRLEDEVARVQRYGFPLSLALIDLDKFKAINDRHGHPAGDEVLRVYANNILSIFRHHDLVARYGGEEFAVLLPNTDAEGAERALAKVRNRARESIWQCDSDTQPVPTFSAGLALYKPGETSGSLIERADKALYRAKHLGRDRVETDAGFQPVSATNRAEDVGTGKPV